MFQSIREQILTVTELTQRIKFSLEVDFAQVWVEGEISNLRSPSSGHLYFTLKDEKSQIRTVIFRNQNQDLPFQPQDGLQVISRGRISVYEPRGEYQLIVDYLEPKGIGALQLAFEQLKEKLVKEGLFDVSHKKPFPLLPQRIGLVTSPSGAVLRDILNILQRRFANLNILVYPVRVQGEGASLEIARAIEHLNQLPLLTAGKFWVDVIIIARGGGSLEDLWAFNEEVVARAIYNSKIPIISAVGHETDFTIADFVADLRAPTPSTAAELVIKSKLELINTLKFLESRLTSKIKQTLEERQKQLIIIRKDLVDPRRRIEQFQIRLDDFFAALSSRISLILQLKKERFNNQVGRLDALSPLSILKRGYSIVRLLPTYQIVKRADIAKIGQKIEAKFHQGEIICEVKEVRP